MFAATSKPAVALLAGASEDRVSSQTPSGFSVDDLPMIPPKMSIARSLIDSFLLRDR